MDKEKKLKMAKNIVNEILRHDGPLYNQLLILVIDGMKAGINIAQDIMKSNIEEEKK